MVVDVLIGNDRRFSLELIVVALASMAITVPVFWLLVETGLPPYFDNRFGLLLTTVSAFSVPVGITAWLVWRGNAPLLDLVGVFGVFLVVMAGQSVLSSGGLLLLAFLLFALPAFVAGRLGTGLIPGTALAYLPTVGALFSAPYGRLGPLTVWNRLSIAFVLGAIVAIVAAALYGCGRAVVIANEE